MFPRAQTTASAIESTAKGTTEPEEAVETTIGTGDDTGYPAERRQAIVGRTRWVRHYVQSKQKPVKSDGTTSKRNTTAARKPQSTTGEMLLGCFCCGLFLPQLGTATLGPPKKTTLSDQRAPIGPATSER